jgi:hypothetical protein
MHIQQFNNLKKIATQFSNDYQLSSELYDRHVELIEAVAGCEMEESFKRAILRAGVRYEVLEAAFESDDFEELMSSFKRDIALNARCCLLQFVRGVYSEQNIRCMKTRPTLNAQVSKLLARILFPQRRVTDTCLSHADGKLARLCFAFQYCRYSYSQ